MTSSTAGRTQAEIAAEKATAAKAMPQLLAYRNKLEKEAGVLWAVQQRRLLLVLICSGGAILAGLYSLWVTVTTSPPAAGWIIAGGLAAVGAFIGLKSKHEEGPRERRLEELHSKMLAVGRNIDRTGRKLRQ